MGGVMSTLRCEHCGQEHDGSLQFCPVTGKITHPERFFPEGTLIGGKYRLAGVLGSGGMGAVFEATHTMLQKRVALKLMLPEMARDRELMSRMVREARAASASGHRNVISVTDMGWTEEGALFLVMEFLEGCTLRKLIREAGPQPVPRSATIVFQILSALAAVHDRGIIHRDLKPDNVMIISGDEDDEEGELVKVLDFGISKILRADDSLNLTRTGSVLGSPRYMAPEQARGMLVDERTDIYAVGGILFHLLAGRPALQASGFQAMVVAILAGEIDPPSTFVTGIPAELDAVVLKALDRDPAARFSDARAFRQALLPFLDDRRGARRAISTPDALVSSSPDAGDAAAYSFPRAPENLTGSGLIEPAAAPGRRFEDTDQVATLVSPKGSDVQGIEPLATGLEPLALSAFESSPSAPSQDKEDVLELDVDDAWRREGGGESEMAEAEDGTRGEVAASAYVDDRPAPQAKGTLYAYGGWRRRLGAWIFPILILVVLGIGGYHYRRQVLGWFGGGGGRDLTGLSAKNPTVLLWIATVPRHADIYLDGALQVSGSFALERSERLHDLRVQAPGYVTKRLKVRANITRRLTVRLSRSRR